jgi:hypothetical protein
VCSFFFDKRVENETGIKFSTLKKQMKTEEVILYSMFDSKLETTGLPVLFINGESGHARRA